VRTSTKRDLAFAPDEGRWSTLRDERIDKVLIAAQFLKSGRGLRLVAGDRLE
jgi:hypothetical protein